jgi:hypothetical protein
MILAEKRIAGRSEKSKARHPSDRGGGRVLLIDRNSLMTILLRTAPRKIFAAPLEIARDFG